MAKVESHSDDQLTSFIKESNTGHAEHPAMKAPMNAKQTALLGAEQTSDGARAEKREEENYRQSEMKRGVERKQVGLTKLEKAALRSVEKVDLKKARSPSALNH